MNPENMTAEIEEVEFEEVEFDPTLELGEVDQSDLQSLASMGFQPCISETGGGLSPSFFALV